MTAFLARSRRLFLAGFISLIIIIALGENFAAGNSIQTFYYFYFGLSPIIYLVLTLLSALLIRHFGQFAAVHKQHNYFHTFFRAIGSDLVSPFKNLKGFITALVGKYPEVMPDDMIKKSKGVSIRRFIWTIFVLALCAVGIFIVF